MSGDETPSTEGTSAHSGEKGGLDREVLKELVREVLPLLLGGAADREPGRSGEPGTEECKGHSRTGHYIESVVLGERIQGRLIWKYMYLSPVSELPSQQIDTPLGYC